MSSPKRSLLQQSTLTAGSAHLRPSAQVTKLIKGCGRGYAPLYWPTLTYWSCIPHGHWAAVAILTITCRGGHRLIRYQEGGRIGWYQLINIPLYGGGRMILDCRK